MFLAYPSSRSEAKIALLHHTRVWVSYYRQRKPCMWCIYFPSPKFKPSNRPSTSLSVSLRLPLQRSRHQIRQSTTQRLDTRFLNRRTHHCKRPALGPRRRSVVQTSDKCIVWGIFEVKLYYWIFCLRKSSRLTSGSKLPKSCIRKS